MAIEALGEHRNEVELMRKKIFQKTQALNEAVETISQAFPHIYFNPEQSCFLYLNDEEMEKVIKARKLKQAGAENGAGDRSNRDCCLLL